MAHQIQSVIQFAVMHPMDNTLPSSSDQTKASQDRGAHEDHWTH